MMFARKPAVADRGEVYFFHQRGIITRSNPVIRGLQFGESLKKKKKKEERKKGSRSRLHPTRNVCVFERIIPRLARCPAR